MIPIYVAGDSTEIIDKLKNNDCFTIINDVTKFNKKLTVEYISGYPATIQIDANYIYSIKKAYAVVVILSGTINVDCEIGFALGMGIPIYLFNLSNDSYTNSIYWNKNINKYSNINNLIRDLSKIYDMKVFNAKMAKLLIKEGKQKRKQKDLGSVLIHIYKMSVSGRDEITYNINPNRKNLFDFDYVMEELKKRNFEVFIKENGKQLLIKLI